VRTVQGDIESALSRLFARPVTTACAGRTDAGVHALAQVVTTEEALDGIDLAKLRSALNGMCGPSIAFASCREAPEGFHARSSARSRVYVYAVLEGDVPDPWLARTTLYHPLSCDLDAMNEAAGHLVGKHDFSSFGRVPQPDASAERTLFELRCARAGRLLTIRARADSFIQQMVRSLAGTLLEVGEGKRSPDEMPDALRARDRAAAGAVASPHGLCLVAVEYDEGWGRPPSP
jgi:tRNA pseudouridine38-40 synthase